MAEEQQSNQEQRIELPPVTFIGHIDELAYAARMYLSGMQDPETQQPVVQLDMAKRLIDTMEMLQAKTQSNLEAPERNYLENTLYDLRMTFVRMATAKPEPPAEESQSPEVSVEAEQVEPAEEASDE